MEICIAKIRFSRSFPNNWIDFWHFLNLSGQINVSCFQNDVTLVLNTLPNTAKKVCNCIIFLFAKALEIHCITKYNFNRNHFMEITQFLSETQLKNTVICEKMALLIISNLMIYLVIFYVVGLEIVIEWVAKIKDFSWYFCN